MRQLLFCWTCPLVLQQVHRFRFLRRPSVNLADLGFLLAIARLEAVTSVHAKLCPFVFDRGDQRTGNAPELVSKFSRSCFFPRPTSQDLISQRGMVDFQCISKRAFA
jgi:hypothetical protein